MIFTTNLRELELWVNTVKLSPMSKVEVTGDYP